MFKGSFVALVTPFKNNEIDEKKLRELVDWHIAEGTNGLVPVGTTGEASTLSYEEHYKVIEIVASQAKKRVPVVAGAGSNSTQEAIELTREAARLGADAVLSVNPYYNKPTQEGLRAHFTAIAKASPIPVMLYNIPSRTGSKIEATTIARLAPIEHIVGVKEATGSLDEVQELIRLCGEQIEVYSGDDSLTLPILAVGGVATISVVANVLPAKSAAMVGAALAGDWEQARKLHYEMLPLIRVLFLETNPIPVKAALAKMGYCEDDLRLPLLPMSAGPRADLERAMGAAGLI